MNERFSAPCQGLVPWSCRHPLPSMNQNSRFLEESRCSAYQLGRVRTLPKSKSPNTSRGPTLQAGPSDSSPRACYTSLFLFKVLSFSDFARLLKNDLIVWIQEPGQLTLSQISVPVVRRETLSGSQQYE